MTVSVAVVCEAPADRITITTLAERVICESAHWIDPAAMNVYVEWRGFRRSDTHLEWTDVKQLAGELKLVVRFRDVQPIHPYAQNALRAIRVLARAPDRVDAIIMVPDSDTDMDRLKGLAQARECAHEALPIIIGLAHTKRECWHICGFKPENDKEERLLAALRSELGFDAITQSQELTAKHDHDKLSAKRVKSKLIGDNHKRGLQCLKELSIAQLKERGTSNGLTDFLQELEANLIPLFKPSVGGR